MLASDSDMLYHYNSEENNEQKESKLMPIIAKQTVNQDWDFEVAQEELFLPDGAKSGYLAARRLDNNEVLGIHTDRYGIVKNADLVDKAESAFARKGLTNYERKIYVTDGGAKLRVNYGLQG